LKKVVKVIEQSATQHIGEVIVQHLGVAAKLVRRDVLASVLRYL